MKITTADRNCNKGCKNPILVVVWGLMAVIGFSPLASAQGWEWTYGQSDQLEDGRLRVIPVTMGCDQMTNYTQTDGYIAVGWIPVEGVEAWGDVYVVRTDNSGAKIWEKSYDIRGNGDGDFGNSIIELSDGSGFAITGGTLTSLSLLEAFILKIDCEGNVVWSNTYGRGTTQEEGRDIIETKTGTALQGTSAGDLVVCGTTDFGVNGTINGLIFRVTSGGAMIWARPYQPGALVGDATDIKHDRFEALTECSLSGTQTTGDIIAVGHTIQDGAFTTPTAWSARVDGDNGATFGGPLQGIGLYATNSQFFAVEELSNPNETSITGDPNILMAGTVNTPFWGMNGQYIVKLTGGDPCVVAGQTSLLDRNRPGNSQTATTLREITFPTGSYSGTANQWNVAVSGHGNIDTTHQSQALLTIINPATLNFVGTPTHFGGTGREEAWSVSPVDAIGGRSYGFILCGYTDTDWESDGDPGDMYLIKTDGSGQSGCENLFDPEYNSIFGNSCPGFVTNWAIWRTNENTSDLDHDLGHQICSTAAARPVVRDMLGEVPSFATATSSEITLPISLGSASVVLYDVRGIAAIGSPISVGTHSITIKNNNLAPGTYFIRDDDGKSLARFVLAK